LDVLDYRPSQLELVPDLVLVEGKNDFYTLRYAFRCILKCSPELCIAPGGGAGSFDPIIRLYVGWAKNFIVLLDGDREGAVRQRERYEKEFGELVKPRLFTLTDALPELGDSSIESVFDPEERLQIQRVGAPESKEFDKKQFNRAVQEACLRSIEVQLGNATKEKLRTLHKFLVDKLAEKRST